MWKVLKWLYNHVPVILQRMLVLLFGMVIYLAKLVVTRQNPLNKTRGMDFWYDVVDWIGGYPYEHATAQKIRDYVEALGLQHRKTIPPTVPTGCNEFVFIKSPQ
jgi:2-polyprenyl-6-hydroxyphenyl methylase/3-demethylubiquinone-9 3-methyltransferase